MIRKAELKDVPRMLELGIEMHKESQYAPFNIDDAKLANFLEAAVDHDDCVCFVFERDGEVIGGVLGWVTDHYFGNDRFLCDLALFVEKSKRGAVAGALLIKKFLEAGKEKGCVQIVLSNSTGVDKDRVANLYGRLGMTHVGYVYALNTKAD